MDATKRVNDMIVILERFAEVLDRENAALVDHKNEEVSALLEEKSALSRVYESRARGLLEHPDDLAQVDAQLRARLKDLNRKTDTLIGENARLLKVSVAAQKMVVEVIREAVKQAQAGPKTYSAIGAALGGHRPRQGGTPMAFDKTL